MGFHEMIFGSLHMLASSIDVKSVEWQRIILSFAVGVKAVTLYKFNWIDKANLDNRIGTQ